MWTRLFLVVLVAAASAQAWRPNTGFSYKVQSRTLSALHQVGDQYSGMLMRATLKVYAKSPSKLYAQVVEPEYADVHQALPGGWGSPIPEQSVEWQKLDLSDKPFIILLSNGVIDRLLVERNMPEWELNILKGIVSQLQVDAKAENYINSRINDLPSDDSVNAVYKTMEDTVTGKCEVLYDMSPLPEYILQSHPQLVPKPSSNPEAAPTLDIVKTTNYSNCEKRPAFHHGFNGGNDMEPASSKMGQFLARSSVSRVVITGRPSKHLIQSSVTTNKVILSPAVYNNQKGMVVSRMNLTLLSVTDDEETQAYERADQEATVQVNDLVYDLTHPSRTQTQQDPNSEEKDQADEQVQTSEEKRMQGPAAQRFRRKLKQQVKNIQDAQESSESSSYEDSSVSTEEWQEVQPTLNQRPRFPFLPLFIGNKGQSVQKKIDIVDKSAEIARDIAKDLQKPDVIPEKATLTKFSILIRLVQIMNTEELQQLTEKMYSPDESSKDTKAWKVTRDAVTQTGTSPALVVIKQWIESKKVWGEEAAEILAQASEKVVIPNKEYIHLFYDIATSEAVKDQRHLNTTAILSFANLVRNAVVDRRSAHNRYPTHAFGRMNPAAATAVTRYIVPYLAKQLREAVREGDSVRIQTFIRALGNVAHPKILAVFEPYLEGEKQVSDFQRLHMVVALNQLVKVRPSLARRVLYRIYKNTAETPDVRSAAVFLLMKTNPSSSMLQRLAESTNSEYSKQVLSAVQTALQYAAELQAPESQQLADNAKAAINILNNTNFGPEYSKIKLASGDVPEYNIAYRAGYSRIGSEDYLAPKAAFVHIRQIFSGLKQDSRSLGYMSSSSKDLINLIAAQSQKFYSMPENADIFSETAQQIEGNFFIKNSHGERFIAFDNHTIERIPSAVKDALEKMSQGQTFSFQRMYNMETRTLAVPTASGLPFYYTLNTPTILSVEGKVQTDVKPEISSDFKSAQASADVKILLSTKTEARLGFVAPFNSKHYIAGTDKEAQINLPIRAEMEMNTAAEGSGIQKTHFRMKVQPRKPDEDTKVALLRSRPFTAQQSIVELKPAQQKVIVVSKPQKRSFTIGREETGMAFRVEASDEKESFNYAQVLRQLKKLDALSALASLAEEKTIKNYDYSVAYDHDKSRAKAVVFTAAYGHLEKKPQSDSYGYAAATLRTRSRGTSASDSETEQLFKNNPAIPTNSAPDSEERLKQFLNRVTETMEMSRADALDVSAQFKGDREAVYVATVAGARSTKQDQASALVYFRRQSASGKKQQVAFFPFAKMSQFPSVKYQKAIESKPTAFVEAKFSFGEDLDDAQHSQIHIKSKFERSAQREQFVREQPISQLCQQQASHGNNFLPACQNATTAAGHMDQYDIAVKYARIPDSVKNATYKAYSLARHFGWQYNSEDLISAENAERKINLNVRFARDLQSMDVAIRAPAMNAEFTNVDLSPFASAALVAHPNYKPSELVSRYVFGKNYNPTCTIDKSAVNTFDNKTYPLNHDDEWLLVAQYVPKKYEQVKISPASQLPFIKVQTRQTPSQQKEVKIILGTQDVVEIDPRGSGEYPEVKVNNKRYTVESQPTEVESKVDNRVFVQFFALPDGTTRLTAPQYSLDITYDATTFVLNVGNEYRSDIRGLCGNFDGETETDFTAPQNCIMKDPRNFVKSYIVTGDGEIKDQKFYENEPRACIYKKTSRGNAVSNLEAGRPESQQQSAEGSATQRCTNQHTKVVEQEGQLCFSLRPMPTCSSHCEPSAQQEKSVAFHCVADSPAARNWAKMAMKGASIDIASKGSNNNLTIRVPESCQRKM